MSENRVSVVPLNRDDAPGLAEILADRAVRDGLSAMLGGASARVGATDDCLAWHAARCPEYGLIGGGRVEWGGFSYFVSRTAWAQGFGREIARQMYELACLWHPNEPLALRIRRENLASIRIAETLGFSFAGAETQGIPILNYREGPRP